MPIIEIPAWLAAAAAVSAAASVGGTAASMVSQNAIKQKQAAAQNAERVRQAQIDQQRTAAVNTAVPTFDKGSQVKQQQSLADQVQQYLTPSDATTGSEYVAQNPGAPKEVTDSMSRQLAGALATGKDYAKNLANVSSYGRMGFDNNLALNRLGQTVQQLNGMSSRSTGVLGTELQGAAGAGVAGNNMAAILQGVGGIADAGVGYGLLTNPIGKVPKV
jgi:hypothetical protein